MDLKTEPKMNAKWVGIVLAFFLPGSAHFLSGDRKAGLLWFFSIWLFAFTGTVLMAVSAKPLIMLGLILMALTATFLTLIILILSYRPTQRLKVKGWIIFALLVIAVNLATDPLRTLLPVRPYKMPTGSMQPTLQGITVEQGTNTTTSLSWLLDGSVYEECPALSSGSISQIRTKAGYLALSIGDSEHNLPKYVLQNQFRPESRYEQGDIIWSGTVSPGDHIMINRLAYLFKEPKRGDIVVFKTDSISHQAVKPDTLYIKRIVGLPGETIGIQSSRIVVNGKAITSPSIFKELSFQNDGILKSPTNTLSLRPDEYLVLGDNQRPNQSLDGRFFGPVSSKSFIGKVNTIYWPISRAGPVQ